MILNVGSLNQTKINAVIDAAKLYPKLIPNPEVKGVEVEIEEFGHPKNINETVGGAINRAKAAFSKGNCSLSFGLEGGLMKVPNTRSGYLETSACAIYDGKEFIVGLGPAFEWPPEVIKKILAGEADASLAFKVLGLTKHEKLGNQPGGIIGYLTEQRIPREIFIRDSVIMALIQLEKPELYK
jgi:inosine/xanthosine triphosphatase